LTKASMSAKPPTGGTHLSASCTDAFESMFATFAASSLCSPILQIPFNAVYHERWYTVSQITIPNAYTSAAYCYCRCVCACACVCLCVCV
jgi:hypothetical protein